MCCTEVVLTGHAAGHAAVGSSRVLQWKFHAGSKTMRLVLRHSLLPLKRAFPQVAGSWQAASGAAHPLRDACCQLSAPRQGAAGIRGRPASRKEQHQHKHHGAPRCQLHQPLLSPGIQQGKGPASVRLPWPIGCRQGCTWRTSRQESSVGTASVLVRHQRRSKPAKPRRVTPAAPAAASGLRSGRSSTRRCACWRTCQGQAGVRCRGGGQP